MKRRAGKFTCEQCGVAFEKAQGLRMHVLRAHRGMDPNSPQPDLDEATLARRARQREYARRTAERKRQREAAAQALSVRYCPECGCNIAAVMLALQMARSAPQQVQEQDPSGEESEE